MASAPARSHILKIVEAVVDIGIWAASILPACGIKGQLVGADEGHGDAGVQGEARGRKVQGSTVVVGVRE